MKNNLYENYPIELIGVENNSIEQALYRKRFVLTGQSVLQNTLPPTPTAGYGRCRACGCKGYISKHDGSHECKTCHHHYDRHN